MSTNRKSIPQAAPARAGALRVTYDPQVDASYVYLVGDGDGDGDAKALESLVAEAHPRRREGVDQLLTDRQVANTICGTLLANGIPRQDVEDARQEVYIRALRFFRLHEAPKDLHGMKAFCATVARNYAIDQHRKAGRRNADLASKCKREEYGWVEQEPVTRDPVDADRQLEVLADLFRENRMPKLGVEILEGVVSKCSYEEIGQDLGITADAVERRMRTMRKAFRKSMARLGLLPQMQPLLVLLRNPSALPMLREAA